VGEELLHVAEPRGRHGVAAVEQRMHHDPRHLLLLGEIDQREEMFVERVDAA
jgi:hypothetical protein